MQLIPGPLFSQEGLGPRLILGLYIGDTNHNMSVSHHNWVATSCHLILLVGCTHSQETTRRQVAEGISKNVEILCDLNGWVYWKINILVYSSDGLPDIYNTEGNNLILPNVDRTLDDYTYQCLAVERNGERFGSITILDVLYGM